jgi:hypothetical protein
MSGLPFVIITCLRPVVNSDEARVLCSFAYWVSLGKAAAVQRRPE